MVYVINYNDKPLMPTNKHGWVRHVLDEGKAVVVSAKPFTIKLLYEATEYVQPAKLGIDPGYLNLGFSAVTETDELICGEAQLLEDMSMRIYEKAMYRRNRRGRLRYRKNRGELETKPKGWLAPSIQHKLDTQIKLITDKIAKIVPIGPVVVEKCSFDIQKIMNPDIKGKEYQQGKQYGHLNVRQYVLHRDGYKCQNPDCKNEDEKPTLIAHHLRYQHNGGTQKPDDQITLCSQCHSAAAHLSFLKDWEPDDKDYKPETYMTTVYKRLMERLTELGYKTDYTYGYITKGDREALGLEKTHANDAFCIAGGTTQTRSEPFVYVQTRRNNRSLETWHDAKYIDLRTGKKVAANMLSCGRTTRNKNKNGENLKKHRGKKISDGRRQIRHQRYPNQPGDIVWFEGKKHTCKWTQNKGRYVMLEGRDSVAPAKNVRTYRYSKGLVCL